MEHVLNKYHGKIDKDILIAVVHSYFGTLTAEELDEHLAHLVIPQSCSSKAANKTYPQVVLTRGLRPRAISHSVRGVFKYTNNFKDRIIAVYAESKSPDICQVLSPTRSLAVRVSYTQSTSIRLVFSKTHATSSASFTLQAEVLVKDAFSGRLLERLHFPVYVIS